MSSGGTSVFIFLCVIIGIICKEFNKRYKIPYTPFLLVIGLLWGMFLQHLGLVGAGAKVWSDLDAHTILLIFIPVLIFESAFGTDFYTFKREFWQIMLLATPGLIISTLLTAIVVKYVLQYDDRFDWPNALMFGSVLSATDPVAVVALLKELGVNKRLSTLIEGESLLNDGTAIVAFEVFLSISLGETLGGDDIVILFTRLSIGGPVLGILFGVLMSIWLSRVYNDTTIEIALTFFTCYMLFWVAEMSPVKVSGVLALVALGFYMSGFGKTYISVRSEAELHSFWKFLAWLAETMIFLLSGIIIGDKVLYDNHIHWLDWILLFVFYIFIMGVRSIVVFIFFPILKRSGYGLTPPEGFILVYGGLRGAVGLALALIVYHEEDITEDVRELVLFHTAGIATLTLLVNGTTTGFFINKFGIIKPNPIKDNMMGQFI